MRVILAVLLWFTWPAWSLEVNHGESGHSKVVVGELQTDLSYAESANTAKEVSNKIAQLVVAENEVVMYATSWCPYCAKARKYFRSNNISYTEYDIEKDMAAKQRYKKLGGDGIPLIFIGEERLDGFSEDSFRRVYSRKK